MAFCFPHCIIIIIINRISWLRVDASFRADMQLCTNILEGNAFSQAHYLCVSYAFMLSGYWSLLNITISKQTKEFSLQGSDKLNIV